MTWTPGGSGLSKLRSVNSVPPLLRFICQGAALVNGQSNRMASSTFISFRELAILQVQRNQLVRPGLHSTPLYPIKSETFVSEKPLPRLPPL